MDTLLFWIFALMSIVASLLVVGQRNPMRSVLLLIVSFMALSGLYVLLDAYFIAAIQIIIYAGAIMVLFLFVVMLLNVPTEDPVKGYHARLMGAGPRAFGAVLSITLAAEVVWALMRSTAPVAASDVTSPGATVPAIGVKLFTDYAFAFEATSVLILVAMVGAVILARKEPRA